MKTLFMPIKWLQSEYLGLKHFNVYKKTDINKIILQTEFEIKIKPVKLHLSLAITRIQELGLNRLQFFADLFLGTGSLISCFSKPDKGVW